MITWERKRGLCVSGRWQLCVCCLCETAAIEPLHILPTALSPPPHSSPCCVSNKTLYPHTHKHTQHNGPETQRGTPQVHTRGDNPHTTCAKVDSLKTMLHHSSRRNRGALKDIGLRDGRTAQCVNTVISRHYSQATDFYQLLKPFPFRHGNNEAQLRATEGLY